MLSDFEAGVAAALTYVKAGEVCLAAVSGGADSTAMVAALASIRNATPGFDLRCIHVEHGIRPAEESRGDAEFVRALCANLNIPCVVVSVPPGKIAKTAASLGIGIEAAARQYRRRAWFGEARSIAACTGENGKPRRVRICTAHTRDDLLETVLMRVLRGAGPAGLAAMPVQRGCLLRPLLALSRADVLRYLREKELAWREDSTNQDAQFLRNRVRRRLVPLLDESFPHWQSGLFALAQTQSLAADFIGQESRRLVQWTVHNGTLSTGAEPFFSQNAIIREEALFQGIDLLLSQPAYKAKNGLHPVRRKAVRRFGTGATAADLGPLRILRNKERVVLAPKKNGLYESGFALLIKAPGLYTLKGVTITAGFNLERTGAFFSALLPLVIRPAFGSDRIFVKGRNVSAADFARGSRRLWSAVDRLGTAAFIGGVGVLAARTECGERPEITITIRKGRN